MKNIFQLRNFTLRRALIHQSATETNEVPRANVLGSGTYTPIHCRKQRRFGGGMLKYQASYVVCRNKQSTGTKCVYLKALTEREKERRSDWGKPLPVNCTNAHKPTAGSSHSISCFLHTRSRTKKQNATKTNSDFISKPYSREATWLEPPILIGCSV